MTATQETALASFTAGMNCAQSVLTTYAEALSFDAHLAEGIACGFGGGMGRMQETCGAVTGAFMAISIANAPKAKNRTEQRNTTYAMVREFSDRFTALHGTKNCRLLLGVDLTTEEGHAQFAKDKLRETVCCRCIADSVAILDDLLCT